MMMMMMMMPRYGPQIQLAGMGSAVSSLLGPPDSFWCIFCERVVLQEFFGAYLWLPMCTCMEDHYILPSVLSFLNAVFGGHGTELAETLPPEH